MMFKRRDIPPALLLLLLIVLVMLTLSQILVVHNGRYGRNVHNLRKLQLELREMDVNLHSLMLQNVPSIELNRRLLQNQLNEQRVKVILEQAAAADDTQSLHDDDVTHNNRSKIDDVTVPDAAAILNSEQHRQMNLTSNHSNAPILSVNRTVEVRVGPQDNGPENNHSRTALNYCPAVPPGLLGRALMELHHYHYRNQTEAEILAENPQLLPGGTWRPAECTARHRVAVVIPYRDRQEHLVVLLSHLIPILTRQQLDFHVLVVEQEGADTFNKARIMNIAFLEGLKLYNFQCFIFHDVDLVPEDDRNMYSCPIQPRHMSVAIDEMGYTLAYQELVGGVLSMRKEHFQRVNGYSNLYWGWGAEDDDMAYRIMHVGLKITRPPESIARYKMIKHTKRKPADWRKRAKLLYTGTRRFQFDGLNSLQYRVVHVMSRPLYTHILVNIGRPPKGFR